MAARRAVPTIHRATAKPRRLERQQLFGRRNSITFGGRRSLRRLTIATLSVAAASLTYLPPAATAAIIPLPDGDGFYFAPPNVGDFQPGADRFAGIPRAEQLLRFTGNYRDSVTQHSARVEATRALCYSVELQCASTGSPSEGAGTVFGIKNAVITAPATKIAVAHQKLVV